MSITIDLSPEEEAQLDAAAQAEGIDRAEVLIRLIRTYLPEPKITKRDASDEKN